MCQQWNAEGCSNINEWHVAFLQGKRKCRGRSGETADSSYKRCSHVKASRLLKTCFGVEIQKLIAGMCFDRLSRQRSAVNFQLKNWGAPPCRS
jgi:hypothetical protein